MHASPRLRALYLQPGPLFGGAERQAATNIPLLPAFGVDVVPLVGPGQAVVDWLAERGVHQVVFSRDFPGAWPKPQGAERLRLPWRYAVCAAKIALATHQIITRERIDIVYAALPFSWVAATPVARRLGVPIVWRAGGTELRSSEMAALRAFAAIWPPDLLICCSRSVRDTFAKVVRAPAEVVMNGVDIAQFWPGASDGSALRPGGARLVVGFAARLVPQKRPEDFIAMAARIAAGHRDVAFLVAGEGSLRLRYEDLARAFGLGGRLGFLGFVADMRTFYAACDVFVLPSRSEGCPNAVLEAMATRRALVVSDAAGTREVLRDGREGLVYPIGDVERLTTTVARVLENPLLRDDLAQGAYERVTREFSAQATARRLAALFAKRAGACATRAARTGLRRHHSFPTKSGPVVQAAGLDARTSARRTPPEGRRETGGGRSDLPRRLGKQRSGEA